MSVHEPPHRESPHKSAAAAPRTGLAGLPANRPVETALTYLPGVSRARAKSLLDAARIDPETSTDALSELQVDLLRQLLRGETETPLSAGGGDLPGPEAAASQFAPYLSRVRAMLQRYLVVLRPWERADGGDVLPAGLQQSLDATCLRCLRDEALDPERVAFVQRQQERLQPRYDDLVPETPGAQRLDELRVIFGLTDLECDLLWLLLAPELAPDFLWLYRALWRDTQRSSWPDDFLHHGVDPFGIHGAAVLTALGPMATLRRYGLVLATPVDGQGLRLRAARFLVGYLQGLPVLTADLPGVLLHGTDTDTPRPVAPTSKEVRDALTRGFRGRRRFLVLGPARAGALRMAADAQAALGEGLLEVRLDLLLADGQVQQLGHVFGRARLARAGLFLAHAEVLDAGDHGAERLAEALQLLQAETTTMFLHAPASTRQDDKRLSPRVHLALLRELGCLELPTQPPGLTERQDLWRDRLQQAGAQPAELDDAVASAAVFKFGVDEIDLAVGLAGALARTRPQPLVLPGVGQVRLADVERACRDVASSRLQGLATRISVRGRWDSTVLPQDTLDILHEMVRFGRFSGYVLDQQGYGRTMGYGRAITALFSGPSGTGKTLCAGLVARELGLELFRVDLASVVSKYIGETEERLSKLFDASQDAGIALLFDEADSLFAKRTDVQSSVDRYANLEVNYLLQRLEDFDGVAILTTNHPDSIDTAFLRRIRFKPHFPPPEAPERERLWRVMVPADAPQDHDLKLRELAEDYELTGGQIQNAVLRAAVWAAERSGPLTAGLLARAAEREYKDQGRVVREYLDE